MNAARHGCFQLSGRAYVENARPVPGKPRSVILDVYFFGSPDQEKNEIACSLRFFKGDDAFLIAGLYDVVATVYFFENSIRKIQCLLNLLPFVQVVAFRPHINEPSSIISVAEFKLMGDISEVSALSFIFSVKIHMWAQLKPIPIATDQVISSSKHPALVIASGSVTFVDEAQDYFCLTPSQYVSGATQNDALALRAFMNRSTPCLSRELTLPCVNGLVGFTGKLHSFEENDERGSEVKIRAIVYVETISHLTQRYEDSPAKKKIAVSDSFEDDDTITLKNRFRKYVEHSDFDEAKPATVGKDTQQGSSKAKRKLTLTFDGVGREKVERGDCKRR